jgi:hypothetical protein
VNSIDPLRYPIGPLELPEAISAEHRLQLIQDLDELPRALRHAMQDLAPGELSNSYRADGWTIRQLIQHLADSHINGYVRFKLALTEATPTVKPYDEAAWADLPDSMNAPVELSLALLDAVHQRWVALLHDLPEDRFARAYHHPQMGRSLTLDLGLVNYAWHGRHHLAHLRLARTHPVMIEHA